MMQRWRAARVMATYIISDFFLHIQPDSPADRVFLPQTAAQGIFARTAADHPFRDVQRAWVSMLPDCVYGRNTIGYCSPFARMNGFDKHKVGIAFKPLAIEVTDGTLSLCREPCCESGRRRNDSGRAVKQLQQMAIVCQCALTIGLRQQPLCSSAKSHQPLERLPRDRLIPQLRAPYSNSPRSAMRLISSRS